MFVPYLPLQLWNKCWKLDGPWVGCRRCDCVQHFTAPGAFNHALGCPAHRVHGQYPFRDLGMIVEQKIQEELF
ncbi:hypothetical protein CJF35_22125 [Pseudomonas lundensis]|jgi:hypothetical protein|uniref:Uncharacterized protein n=1 Tax=Pseudomonas lundensis TaxID=86185 RepID=A0ABX4GFM3_9PSED|nr:hypothetical protein CJF35_22125 [Pseudomonas lundensis]OZY51403.1 hypothetical protein CJF38_22785 [Pseudomonas lundensis]PAA00659.1 hypothetical protein CJU78_24545 [Pseudomonas fragi]